MKRIATVTITHVKCDADGCDYIDHSANNENLESYRNKPCPECGENLLTYADWSEYQNHLALEKLLNMVGEKMGIEGSDNPDDFETMVKMTTDGNGNTTFAQLQESGDE